MAMKKTHTIEEEEFTGPKGDRFKIVIEKGKLPYWLKERKIPRSLPPEAIQLVYDFLPEFKRLWNAILAVGPVTQLTKEQKINVALLCFDKHSDWKLLSRWILEKCPVWKWRGGQERNDFRGKLLKQIFDSKFPDAPNYGEKMFEKIAKDLEADTK
jgi:hypothetical protein